jgi:acetolactate synthase-1/2/3 large subunit
MAEAYGKLTGRPGICFVTRGPGATNASIGVHTAQQDSTPMILFVGQIGGDVVEREAFQEVDYRRMFGSMVKWVAQIDRAERIPELVSHAFQVAVSGRPGPVVLALPEDMLTTRTTAPEIQRYQRVAASPNMRDMAKLRHLLQMCRKPMLILGGGDWTPVACGHIQRFAERNRLPVACTFRRQDLFDNLHELYAGDVGLGISPTLQKRLKASDLIICVGARLGESTTGGYTLFDVPRLHQRFVHVHPGAEELGRVYQAELMMNSGMPEFAEAAAVLGPGGCRDRGGWDRAVRLVVDGPAAQRPQLAARSRPYRARHRRGRHPDPHRCPQFRVADGNGLHAPLGDPALRSEPARQSRPDGRLLGG